MAEEATKKEEERTAQEIQDEKDGFIPLPEGPEEVEEEVEGAAPGVKPEVEAKPEVEVPAFKLESPIEAPSAKEGEADTIEIVHHGQVHRLTKEKIVELAQKGFDYDFKVGPHGKLAQMVESDPELAQLIQTHWDKKTQKPEARPAIEPPTLEIKPMDDYDNELDWLKGNMEPLLLAIGQLRTDMTQQREAPPALATPQLTPIQTMLMGRDPTGFKFVMSKFPEYLGQVNVQDYQRIDSDPVAICQFYDFVKQAELTKAGNGPTGQPQPKPKPSFKVRSGGGEAPRQDGDADYAWKLSNEEFEKQLAAARGYV